jgi:hypothetical protein
MQENNNPNASTIHVGNVLKSYIDRKRIYKAALARRLKCGDSAIIYYQKSESLKTSVLLEISHALKHNFFSDIAAMLPASYSTDAPIDKSKEVRIAQLELENKLLQAKCDALMEVMKK